MPETRDPQRGSITAITLTYNEEANVEPALQSVRDWVDDIIVVDSGSSDRTRDLCRKYTGRVYEHGFESVAGQFAWILASLDIRTEWVLRLDADDRIPPSLAAEIEARARTSPESVTGFLLPRITHFMGRPLRRAGLPTHSLRVFRKDAVRCTSAVSEPLVLERGAAVHLSSAFVNTSDKRLTFWIDKLAYRAESEFMAEIQGARGGIAAAGGIGGRIYERLPSLWRALPRFLYHYIARGGFLDGTNGLVFHFLHSGWLPFYRDAKHIEAERMGEAAIDLERYGPSKQWVAAANRTLNGAADGLSQAVGSHRWDVPVPLATGQQARAPIALVVLTYNEEDHIELCLSSVAAWVSELIIVDSFSTDRTLEICRRYTDRIYQHPFQNQANQFNWALDHVPIESPWVLRLDADEFVSRQLAEDMCRRLPALPEDVTGLYMSRRVYFMGRWMRHGDYYPRWFLRLFRRGAGRYEEITEEHVVLSRGRAAKLRGDFVDYNRKGLSFWIDKHNHWAIGEMADTASFMGHGELPQGTVRSSLFGTQEQRVRWLKEHVYARNPLLVRAFAYFFYRYIVRLGFLDGREGLIFHFLQGCWYRFIVDAKIVEARRLGADRAHVEREYSGSKLHESLLK